MILNVMRKVTLVAMLAVPAAMMATGCDEASSVAQGLCCTDFRPGADLNGVDWQVDAQNKLEFSAFMQASADFSASASSIVSDLAVACQELAVDLGASDSDVTESDPGKRAEQWCNLAADKLSAKVKAAGQVTISAQPPVCTISASAKAKCEADCSLNPDCQVTPGKLPTCDGGELRFSCQGKCSGSCTGSAELAVTCSGSCEGTCEGKCDGNDSTASCAGTCEGKCRGTCKAAADVSVQCEGECSGSCEGEIRGPKCTGGVTPKIDCTVDPKCEGSCSASVQARADCEPGEVTVTGGLDEATVVAIKNSLPRIRALLDGRVKLLGGSINDLISLSGSVNSSVTASAKATGCLVTAVAPALTNASEQLVAAGRASVRLSASISGQ